MSISIRPATAADFPQIAVLEAKATADYPVYTIGFPRPGALEELMLSRLPFFFQNPDYHMLAATTAEEEVVGLLIWKGTKRDGSMVEKWKPKLPEGSNVKFFEYYFPLSEKQKKESGVDGLAELQSLNISASHQRQGIGSALMKKFLDDLDGEECCVFASKEGKGLYEKFGFKVVRENSYPLQEYGWGPQPLVTYCLKKEGRKAGA